MHVTFVSVPTCIKLEYTNLISTVFFLLYKREKILMFQGIMMARLALSEQVNNEDVVTEERLTRLH